MVYVCIKYNQQHQNLIKLSEHMLELPGEGIVRGSGHPNQIPENTFFLDHAVSDITGFTVYRLKSRLPSSSH
jgi:hypothetical protein